MTPEERKQIEREAYIKRYLEIKGWKALTKPKPAGSWGLESIIIGWVKEPLMQIMTLEQAFKVECQQEA